MKKKVWIKIISCLLIISVLCSGCGTIRFSGNDSCLIQMGNSKLYLSEAKLIAMTNKGMFEEFYIPLSGTQFWNSSIEEGETFESYVKEHTIWQEISALTVLNAMGDEQEIELGEEEKKQAESAAKDYYQSLTKEERNYTKASQASIRSFIQKYIRAERVIKNIVKDMDLEISDNETRVMDIQTIFIKESSAAQEIKEKLDSGEDFLTVSKAHSQDIKHEFSVGRGELNPVLEKAVFSMESGQTSDILTTDQGYYIIKCINDYNQDLSEQNRTKRAEQKVYKAWLQAVKKFAEDHTLEVNEKEWKNLSLEYKENVKNTSLFEVIQKYFPEESEDK